MPVLALRPLLAADAAIVATLHAASWRTAYRGLLSDAYLAGDVDAERAEAWITRLAALDDTREFGIIAMIDQQPAGFVFAVANADATWGSLIDNLHVATAHRSSGIGPRLLAAAADGMVARAWDRRVHLWVLDGNVRARAFYARLHGVEVERTTKLIADGTLTPASRVAWPDCAVFAVA